MGGPARGASGDSSVLIPPVKVYRKNGAARLPRYASSGAAGADVAACIEGDVVVAPGKRAKIPTGLALEIPAGWEAQVRPRSGLAWKEGLTVINAPGTIDSDYRGELEILLVNLGSENCIIRNGERIAQLVFAPAPQLAFTETGEIAASGRGEGGFGSTGSV
ncbi:MAG: dUTP diphosphatase [Treponema sp.]|jgi:dUTP pyrophosphatase|nr:dUTP diphosphatase [Treponema sp.]